MRGNFSLLVDEARPGAGVRFEDRCMGGRPCSPDAGVVAHVQDRRVPGYKLVHGWSAGVSPRAGTNRGPVVDQELLPDGCAKLRAAEFSRLTD